MSSNLIEYRFRLRDAANTTDVLVVTSVRGDSLPWISGTPTGDGCSLDWLSGKCMSGEYTGKIIDPITSGTSRLFTSITEDAGGRQQQGQRRAFWEFRIDGGAFNVLYAGRLSRYRLDSDIEWTLTVSDWMQAEHEFTLFSPNAPDETIASFLARFPNRGCLFGGPLGTVLGKPDPGGWPMRVVAAFQGIERKRYRLEPVTPNVIFDGVTFTNYEEAAKRVNDIVHQLPRSTGQFSNGTFTKLSDTRKPGFGWVGLIALVNGSPYRAVFNGGSEDGVSVGDTAISQNLLQTTKGHPGIYVDAGEGEAALTPGTIVRVRALTIQPTEACPIYLADHPVDLLNTLEGMAGIPVNAASLTTVKNVIGTQGVHRLRITGPEQLGALLEREIYGPWGIGTRPDSAGAIEIFASRTFANTPPATVITLADVDDNSTKVFDLNTSDAIRQVNFEHHQLTLDSTAGDGVRDTTYRFERENADPGAIGTGAVNYSLEGFIDFGNAQATEMEKWVFARAREVFDRRGRGGITAKTSLLRTGAGANVKLGDEFIFQHPAVVNHNKRYGDDNTVGGRAMQVVHWTPRQAVIEVELEDSGPNAQPLTPGPTLTIAKSTDDGRHVAIVTITNAATLIAAGHAVRLQFATTTGAAPAATDYTDIAFYENAEIPTTVQMPNVFNGRTVYVRARSEKSGSRPSNYSAVQSVALDALNAPTALSATPVGTDGSLCDLAWTPGANATDCVTDIYVRTQGTGFSSTQLVATVDPKTTKRRLENLTPGSLLTATLKHRFAPIGDESGPNDVSFTAAATTRALSTPLFPGVFSGSAPESPIFGTRGRMPVADGTYGIGVIAVELPGTVEAEVAVETAPLSGVFGSFSTLGKATSVPDDYTTVSGTAPNDGKKRRLRARHIGEGQTSSGFTAAVDIDPWAYPLSFLTFKSVQGVAGNAKITDPSVAANVGLGYFDNGTKSLNFTVNWNSGNIQTITLGASGLTVTLTNPAAGRVYTLVFVQDATGARTLPTFSPTLSFGDSGPPSWNTGANKINVISMLYTGTKYIAINTGTGF